MTSLILPPMRHSGLPTPSGDLCPAFRQLATNVHTMLGQGRAVGLLPWETSLTDWILLALASTFPAQMKVVRFAADREARNGADWEWWFRSGSDFAGMRIQAKRRDTNGSWGLKAKAPGPPAEKQVDRLVKAAQASGLPAIYCLYSDRPPKLPTHDQTGPCPHGPLDHTQHGISLLLGRTAQRHASQPRLDNEAVASEAFPWYCLVCRREPGRSLTETVRAFVMTQFVLEQRRQASLDVADSRWVVEDPLGENPPDDIRQAFSDPQARDRLRREGLAGMILFTDNAIG